MEFNILGHNIKSSLDISCMQNKLSAQVSSQYDIISIDMTVMDVCKNGLIFTQFGSGANDQYETMPDVDFLEYLSSNTNMSL